MVRPPVTIARALPRALAGTMPTAATAATAQNPAYANAATILVVSSTP